MPEFHSQKDGTERAGADPLVIGLNIRYMRYVRGWSQLELSKRSGISRTTLIRIEEGKPAYSGTIRRIAAAFGISVTEIYVTTRFRNVLDDSSTFVKHCRQQDYWHALEDNRKCKPTDSQELIQSAQERFRLGSLGFVPAFATGMEFLLPVGPGINRLEVYGKFQKPNMPQFEVNAIYCLKGSLRIVVDGEVVCIEPGEACALHSSSSFSIEPIAARTQQLPCEVLLLGSGRQKVG